MFLTKENIQNLTKFRLFFFSIALGIFIILKLEAISFNRVTLYNNRYRNVAFQTLLRSVSWIAAMFSALPRRVARGWNFVRSRSSFVRVKSRFWPIIIACAIFVIATMIRCTDTMTLDEDLACLWRRIIRINCKFIYKVRSVCATLLNLENDNAHNCLDEMSNDESDMCKWHACLMHARTHAHSLSLTYSLPPHTHTHMHKNLYRQCLWKYIAVIRMYVHNIRIHTDIHTKII